MRRNESALFPNDMPTPAAARDIIRTRAYELALAETDHCRVYEELYDGSIAFGRGLIKTPLTLTREPDGTIACSSPDLRLNRPSDKDYDTLGKIWNRARERATQAISTAFTNTLGLETDLHPSHYPGDTGVQAELDRAASGLRSLMGLGYPDKPLRLMQHLMRRILDPEILRLTLRYAGHTATIESYNTVAIYHRRLRELYEDNPRRLVIWMSSRADIAHQNPLSDTLKSGDALQAVADDVDIALHGRAQLGERLSIKLLRETHPGSRKFRRTLDTLERYGSVPAYSICRMILSDKLPYAGPRGAPIVRELFRLSRQSARKRGRTMKQIMREATTILNEQHSMDRQTIAEWGFTEDPHPAPRMERARHRGMGPLRRPTPGSRLERSRHSRGKVGRRETSAESERHHARSEHIQEEQKRRRVAPATPHLERDTRKTRRRRSRAHKRRHRDRHPTPGQDHKFGGRAPAERDRRRSQNQADRLRRPEGPPALCGAQAPHSPKRPGPLDLHGPRTDRAPRA